jgi:hypothetical protein
MKGYFYIILARMFNKKTFDQIEREKVIIYNSKPSALPHPNLDNRLPGNIKSSPGVDIDVLSDDLNVNKNKPLVNIVATTPQTLAIHVRGENNNYNTPLTIEINLERKGSFANDAAPRITTILKYATYAGVAGTLASAICAKATGLAWKWLSLLLSNNKSNRKIIHAFWMAWPEEQEHKTKIVMSNFFLHTIEDAIDQEDLKQTNQSFQVVKFSIDHKEVLEVVSNFLRYVNMVTHKDLSNYYLHDFENGITHDDLVELQPLFQLLYNLSSEELLEKAMQYKEEYFLHILNINNIADSDESFSFISFLLNKLTSKSYIDDQDYILDVKNVSSIFHILKLFPLSKNSPDLIENLKNKICIEALEADKEDILKEQLSNHLPPILSSLLKIEEYIPEAFNVSANSLFKNNWLQIIISANPRLPLKSAYDPEFEKFYINCYGDNFKNTSEILLYLKKELASGLWSHAMCKVFKNEGKPYKIDDEDAKKSYELAISKCLLNISKEFFLEGKGSNNTVDFGKSLNNSFYLMKVSPLLKAIQHHDNLKLILEQDNIVYTALEIYNDHCSVDKEHNQFINQYIKNVAIYEDSKFLSLFSPLRLYIEEFVRPELEKYCHNNIVTSNYDNVEIITNSIEGDPFAYC